MQQQHGDDLITITDEDGVSYELEVLATLEYNGQKYLALVPSDNANTEEIEVSILKSVEEDGETMLVAIEDEEELEYVYNALIELVYDDGLDDEDDDDDVEELEEEV